MWIWIINIATWLAGNPFVRTIVKGLVNDLAEHAKSMEPIVLAAIKEANGRDDLTAIQKFQYVGDKVAAEFPGVGRSLIDTLVQTTYKYAFVPGA